MRIAFLSCVLLLGACDGGEDRLTGASDEPAMHACEHLSASPTALTAAADEAGASGVVLTANDGDPYRVTLPASAPGYVTLRTTLEHQDVAIFVSERGSLTNLSDLGLSAARAHGVCPGDLADDFRVHVDVPGDYVMTFGDEGAREVTVFVIMSGSDHGGHDGGAHHHDEDAGAHHHDEDAGEHHHHDEDAGPHDHGG